MEPVYTVREAAAILRIDHRDVAALIRRGDIRGFRVSPGAKAPWRITSKALDEFIATREAAARAA